MDRITQLDLGTLDTYTKMGNTSDSSTSGGKMNLGTEILVTDLQNVSIAAFGSDDESTARSVIDATVAQMVRFQEDINAFSILMDTLVDDINNRIVDVEDEFADSLPGKL